MQDVRTEKVIPGMHYGGMNPFTVPAAMLGVEVNSMFQQKKMDSEIISNLMTGRWCFLT